MWGLIQSDVLYIPGQDSVRYRVYADGGVSLNGVAWERKVGIKEDAEEHKQARKTMLLVEARLKENAKGRRKALPLQPSREEGSSQG